MQDVLRFWLERGAAGYRVDAIDRLMKDAQLRDDPPAAEPFGLPLSTEEAQLSLAHSRNAEGTDEALAKIRAAVGDRFMVGEVYLPAARWQPYLDAFDAVFAFELLHAVLGRRGAALGDRGDDARARRGVGALEPRLRPARHSLRRRQRARRRAAAAHPARHRLPLPGRRDRPGRRAGRRAPLRPRGPRPLPAPDAVGRLAGRGLHERRALAAARRPPSGERGGAARRSGLDLDARARADPAAALVAARLPAARRRRPGCWPTRAATT